MRHSYSKSSLQPETSMRGTSIEQLGSFAKHFFFPTKRWINEYPSNRLTFTSFSTPSSSFGAIYQITMNVDKGVCLKYQVKRQNVGGEIMLFKTFVCNMH